VCQAIIRHISHHGAFLSFWSDRGTQLGAAGRIIMTDEENARLQFYTFAAIPRSQLAAWTPIITLVPRRG